VVDAPQPVTLPVIVIGGYLGAGKTTLVNHLLRHAGGRRIAVLVNDFGDVDIDADLIASGAAAAAPDSSTEVLSLAGGCLCCSFGNDLLGTLQALQQRQPPPDLVLIELSGVALPAAVRQTAVLAPGVAVQGTLVLVDAADARRLLADRYVGGTVLQQLQEADWVLVNKPDLADPAALQGLLPWLGALAPAACLVVCAVADLAPERVLAWQAHRGPAPLPTAHDSAPAALAQPAARRAGRALGAGPRGAASVYAQRHARLDDGVDLGALAGALVDPARGVLRAKALVRDAAGQGRLLQVVGGRWTITPATVRGVGRLVLIGLRGRVDAPDFEVPGLALAPSRPRLQPE
jgi:G3E family GTPase